MDLSKKELREYVYKIRKEMNTDTKAEWDSIILEKLFKNELYINAETVFIYVSFEGEVDTHRLIEKALLEGKTVCVPKVISKKEGMEAYKIDSINNLQTGFYGILEPTSGVPLVPPEDINLLIMPGVAFDKTNGRIGYGGGFYDRFLRRVSDGAKKIALSYTFQIFDSIPTDEFDEKIDYIITND